MTLFLKCDPIFSTALLGIWKLPDFFFKKKVYQINQCPFINVMVKLETILFFKSLMNRKWNVTKFTRKL